MIRQGLKLCSRAMTVSGSLERGCHRTQLWDFDRFLLCEYYYKECLLSKLGLNGAKIMSMELEEAQIKFRDALNFLPMPLKALPKTFGFTELKKATFLISSIGKKIKPTLALYHPLKIMTPTT